MSPRVAIATVTHNAAVDLPAYFAALARLEHRPLEVVIADCGSGDESVALARQLAESCPLPVTLLPLGENRGFTGGMNAALAATDAPYALSLNADAAPEPRFVGTLLARLEARPGAGAATGRLLRPAAAGGPAVLDACGMRLTWTWRHLDRGSGELDRGQLTDAERVFGGTGAATLFRRAALEDVAVEGEIFDERYHSFREDAELAFRLAERGWEVLYEPAAVALHRRRALPERRSALPAFVNYHSLKNRYLLRIDHQTLGNFLATLVPALSRDLGALLYVLLRERSSLAAYAWLWRQRRELLAHRRLIQARRTRPASELNRWFVHRGLPL